MGIGVPYMISNNIAYLYLHDTFESFPEFEVDHKIPVIPWSIYPYAGLYFYYPATIALAPHTDKGRMEFLSTMQMMATATFFCVTIFMIFPAEIDMRGDIDWNSMTSGEVKMFKMLHDGDHPWNAWPSLHVIHSYLLGRMFTNWCTIDYANHIFSKPFLIVLWTEWVLLVMSTMTTKQHYMFDAISGTIVGITIWEFWKPAYQYIDAKGTEQLALDLGWGSTVKTSIEAVRLTEWPDGSQHSEELHV